MKKVFVLSMVMVMTVGVLCVFAQEQKAPSDKNGAKAAEREKANRPPDVSGLERRGQSHQGQGPMITRDPNMPRGQRNPDQMMKERNARNEQMLAELEEIKKIAQGEKAEKTVEALQKMIDKKKAEFAKQADEVEKNRQEIMNRIRQRREEGVNPPVPGQPGQDRVPGPARPERARQPRPESQPQP